MTAAETEQRIAELVEAKFRELAGQKDNNGWKDFGRFTRDNGIGRCRLQTLVARGKVECDKSNCTTDKLGRAHGLYLYRWA